MHAHAGWGKKSTKPPPPPQDYVLIRITNRLGKYATRGLRGDVLVAAKAQAAEFTTTEAPRVQRELGRSGFTTKTDPV